ncbi:LysE family translocator [Dermacoccaceae bacterium W4C1]
MAQYLSFVALAAVLALAPGPDSLLTLRSALLGGRRRGWWTIAGISAAGVLQGVVAASGLGALLVRAETVFQLIKWLGALYLLFLGVQAIRSAWRMRDADLDAVAPAARGTRPWAVARQGFLTNITNPKVLAFNIAVLPQFVGTDASLARLLAYALTLAVVGTLVLVVLVSVAGLAARQLQRLRVRRGIEGATGAVMIGFAGALALESS